MNNIGEQPPAQNSNTPSTDMLEAYRQMLASLFIATLGVIIVLGGGALVVHFLFRGGEAGGNPPIVLVVALAGTLGALFSALMRLYNMRDLPSALLHPDLQRLRNNYLLMYSLVPIIMGFVAAIIVYLAVLGGIISGSFFPEFACNSSSGECSSFTGLFEYGPKDAPDFAKAIVVGFVSGFSERLVRDVLGTIDASSK